MTTDTLVLTITRDSAPIVGQYRLVDIHRPTLMERLRSRLNRTLKRDRQLPAFTSGLSVGIKIDSSQYAQLMGMATAPSPDDGYATADLIPIPEPGQRVHDQGILV